MAMPTPSTVLRHLYRFKTSLAWIARNVQLFVIHLTRKMQKKTVLIAVDVQEDCLPEGALGFKGSDSIVAPLTEYAKLAADVVIVSRNQFPPDHESFEPHGYRVANCIKGTHGARVIPELAQVADYVITKGLERTQGAFSAFEGGTLRPLEKLENILEGEQITHITVGGYWLENVVSYTAFDANALGYHTTVDSHLTASLPFDGGSRERTRLFESFERAGIIYV
jgi:nicotinamidase/pyrazinamidase